MKAFVFFVIFSFSIFVQADDNHKNVPNRLGKSSRHPRLVDGKSAVRGEFPSHVYLEYLNEHHCDGSLFSDRNVLTTAHCVHKIYINYLQVVVGTVKISQRRGKRIAIRKISIHPEYSEVYDKRPINHVDIAVIELRNPIKPSIYVQPIKLPEPTAKYAVGTIFNISGFGSTDPDSMESNNRTQKLTFQTIDPVVCQKQWSDAKLIINSSVICAKAVPGGLCYGDSGAGLIDNSDSNNPKLVGIAVAIHFGVCASENADIFTNVAHYLPWIKSVM